MIRMIRDEDIPEILSWYNHYIETDTCTFETEPLDIAQFTQRVRMIREKYPWIVLEEDDRLLGYAYLASFIPRSAYDWTCDLAIYLDPDVKGKGYGAKLMEAILAIAEKAGYRNMVSIVTKGNVPSEHLHEKYGFKPQGILENLGFKFGKWLSVTYYVKKLGDQSGDPQPLTNPAEVSSPEGENA